jgi:hypothetical protein
MHLHPKMPISNSKTGGNLLPGHGVAKFVWAKLNNILQKNEHF